MRDTQARDSLEEIQSTLSDILTRLDDMDRKWDSVREEISHEWSDRLESVREEFNGALVTTNSDVEVIRSERLAMIKQVQRVTDQLTSVQGALNNIGQIGSLLAEAATTEICA